MTRDSLWELGMTSLRSLESEQGILASGRSEAYGCIFGRDSLLTSLDLLATYKKTKDEYFLALVEKSLRTLSNLQGRFTNVNSGEEPGKIIHEYRATDHAHLTSLAENPWYIYPEGVMKNYDTVDATPLFLIAVAEFAQAELLKKSPGGVKDFFSGVRPEFQPAVRAALEWIKKFDGFVTYEFHKGRTNGGLKVQSWMDSTESLFDETGAFPRYPIAPVEVQAYTWKALKMWGEDEAAEKLKEAFNKHFVLKSGRTVSLAYALDGDLTQLTAARSSMGHVLWAAYKNECILDSQYIDALRNRLLARDLFVPKAGIRTLSNKSDYFDPQSYHNGSIWPHDTAILAKGLENFGYVDDARRVREALLNAYTHFGTPVELYTYSRGLKAYKTADGHQACQVQAWSAASLLSILD